jgi:hypothetical protein
MKTNLDERIKKAVTYVFRISGQVNQLTSKYLHPSASNEPNYSQLSILDTKDATKIRMSVEANSTCDEKVF